MAPIKKYWKASAFLVAWLAIFAFLLRHDPQMPWTVLGVAGLCIFSVVLSKFPNLTRWAEANRGVMRLLALAAVIAGPAIAIVVIYLSGGAPASNWVIGATIALIFLGAVLFMLPEVNSNKAIVSEFTADVAGSAAGVSFVGEVKSSFVFVLECLPAFARIVAIWMLLDTLLNAWAVHLVSVPKGSDERLSGGTFFLVSYVFVVAFAMPAVAVAWHRYVMLGELPGWGIVPPNKRFWRYFYRIWIFSLMVGTMDKLVSANVPDIVAVVGPRAAKVIAGGLEDAIYLLAIWGAGMYALVLPAVAIDDRDMNITVALRMVWPRRLQFATGFLATILISYLAIMVLGFLEDAVKESGDILVVTLSALSFLMILFATATSATYLSRAYMRAKTQPLAA